MSRYSAGRFLVVLFLLLASVGGAIADTTTIRVGYFEGGEDPINFLLREEIQRQMTNMTPPDTQFVFVPEGYRSAGWVRDSSRVMAAQLAAVPGIDVMVAVGPWVVQDLLTAGYSRPILGVRQIDLLGAGLVDSTGTPVARNLTVHEMPGKIEDDIAVLTRLLPVEKLGVLWFDAGDGKSDSEGEAKSVIARVTRLGQQAGFETVTAGGFNIHRTYAFFRGYNDLPKDIDALYLGPTWGLTVTMINELLRLAMNDGIPVFTWEGKFLVTRGAFGKIGRAHV